MATEIKHVEIGFFGGGTSARLTEDEFEKLRRAVKDGDWVDVKTADGPLSLNAASVIFLKVDEHSSQIGFRT